MHASAVLKKTDAAAGMMQIIIVRARLPLSKRLEYRISSVILIPAPPVSFAGIICKIVRIIHSEHQEFCHKDNSPISQMPENSATSAPLQ